VLIGRRQPPALKFSASGLTHGTIPVIQPLRQAGIRLTDRVGFYPLQILS
jgi:hypothetical protein